MKVIDLLNKIANGEEVPKKIKYHWEYEYRYDEDRNEYCYLNNQNERFDDEWFIIAMLNDEVAIIEEQPTISHLPTPEEDWDVNLRLTKIEYKIKELVDIVNNLK